MTNNTLTFDADKHEYRSGSRRLPSVTEVINRIMPGFQADEYYLKRGTFTHHGCALLDQGELDWDSVSPAILPRVQAWQKFRCDWPAQCMAIELPLSHRLYQYAGTLDRALRSTKGELTIVDLKNSVSPQVRLQLAAYSLLWKDHFPKQPVRMACAVELCDDGTYRTLWLDSFELRRCEQVFIAALSVFGFMTKHKLKGLNDVNRTS